MDHKLTSNGSVGEIEGPVDDIQNDEAERKCPAGNFIHQYGLVSLAEDVRVQVTAGHERRRLSELVAIQKLEVARLRWRLMHVALFRNTNRFDSSINKFMM